MKSHSLFRVCYQLLLGEWQMVLRSPQETINPIIFFVIVVSLFPLAITPSAKTLSMLAPGVIWVAALLSTLLSLNRLFQQDYDDGTLEQLLLTPYPLPVLASAKVISHWLLSGLPLIIVSPLLAMMLSLSLHSTIALILSLLIGTPLLSFIGAIGSALTVGLRSSGVLLTLLILPLYIPVLIFGTSAVMAAGMGMPYVGHLAVLGAMLVLALTLAPFAIAASLRICVNY